MTNLLYVALGAGLTASVAVIFRAAIVAILTRMVTDLAAQLHPHEEKRGLVIGRVVIVNIKGLRAIAGVLIAVYEDSLVLANARTLPGREKVLGEAVVPRDQIEWVQSDVPPSLLEDVTE